ncbi:WD40 repeat-like protein [Gyrodon lividus]|nr:WD40 repeat-like protein [Gyrodon lividus]
MLRGHMHWINCVAFLHDSKQVINGSLDECVRAWWWEMEKVVQSEGHSDHVLSLTFSPNSAKVVSCSLDVMVIVWSTTTGERFTGPLKGHTRPVWYVSYSLNGNEIASCEVQTYGLGNTLAF